MVMPPTQVPGRQTEIYQTSPQEIGRFYHQDDFRQDDLYDDDQGRLEECDFLGNLGDDDDGDGVVPPTSLQWDDVSSLQQRDDDDDDDDDNNDDDNDDIDDDDDGDDDVVPPTTPQWDAVSSLHTPQLHCTVPSSLSFPATQLCISQILEIVFS